MNMALDEGCLFGIRRLLIWDYKAAYLGLQGCLFGITRLLIWDYKAAYLGLQGYLFGITRPNGLEEIDTGQYVSKVSEVDL
jgi:hypothetical protein